MVDYWRECVSEALDEAGIHANQEQIDSIAESVSAAHENYGMAHGFDVIANPVESQLGRELRELKEQIEKEKLWKLNTEPCRDCCTTGRVQDAWGRDQGCDACRCTGRV